VRADTDAARLREAILTDLGVVTGGRQGAA
jgi:hypothetical protein